MWPGQRRLLTGAMRGLVVSPWFAAGAGFVVAAGAFIYAPHARLEIGETPCKLVVCRTIVPAEEPPVAAGTPGGRVTPAPSTAAPQARLSFTYTLARLGPDRFQMHLTVTARHPIGRWRLSAVIPGATNVSVSDGTSRPGAEGQAGSQAGDGDLPAGPAGGPGPGFTGSTLADHGDDQADSLSLVVDGQGAPRAPEHSYFDGAPCEFSQG